MHINLLPITFLPVDNRRDEHECILGHEVPYASFPPRVCRHVEFESPRERQEGEGEQKMAEGEARHYGQGNNVDQKHRWLWGIPVSSSGDIIKILASLILVSVYFPCASYA